MKQLMSMKRARMSGADERSASRADEGGSERGRAGLRWRALARVLALMCVALLLCGVEARAQSALDGFDPGANNVVYALAVQADGKILVGGDFTTLGGGGTGTTTRNRIGRLNVDGSLDTTFDPGANSTVLALAVQADGKILVVGAFTTLGGGGTGTTTRNRIGRLNLDGTLDTTFDPGANNTVWALALQADGKILVGGDFTTLGGGGTGTTTRNLIGRLNPDGTLDTSFNPGANGQVVALAVQADGKILVGGVFDTLGGGGTGTTTRNCIGRLNPDGTLDTSFDPGANEAVYTLALQADGKILVGGLFTMLGGGGTGTTTRNRIGRLNVDGSLDTTFDPGANGQVNALAVQADGKILVVGLFTTLGGGGFGTTTRNRIGRLNADGSLDTTFDPGANGEVYALSLQADGKIVVAGFFTGLGAGTGTTARNRIGRLYPDGTLDTTFDPGANNTVWAIAVQADGKILVGGDFSTLGGGGTGTTARNRIGRLNADGSLDTTFNPGANFTVRAIAVQADGKILVGGNFTTLGGGGSGTTARNNIGRLNPDGTLDTTFNPGANSPVVAIAVQADGKIIVGGLFTTLGGGGSGTTARNNIGRLNPDGTLDTSFNPGANSTVRAFAVQADGKILVGGQFTMLGGGGTGTTTRNRIGRLNSDGSLDTSFNPGANNEVRALAVQADGKILVGGLFNTLGGGGTGTTTRNGIGRLNADGSPDTSFNPGANDAVFAIAVQADGKIIVGGNFTTLGGGGTGTTTRNHIGRLNVDGSLDTSFNPGANNTVLALAVQADGKILVGGDFSMLGGGGTGTMARNRIGRLSNNIAALQSLTVSFRGTSVRWLRSGASPELERVTFELSTDGITYTPLGNGSRINNGWLLTGLSLPTQQNIYVRARGFYHTGYVNGSNSIVESVRNAYITIAQAANGTLFDFDGDKRADVSIWNPSNHNWYILQSSDNALRIQLDWGNGSLGDIPVPADYDGDGKCDTAFYRPSEGNWYIIQSQSNTVSIRNWGISTDTPVPADYDGDGKTDIAVWRGSEGNWYIIRSGSGGTVQGWGLSALGDKPVPADYDGDGRADIAIYRPSEGNWYILKSNNGTPTGFVQNWGESGDKLVPADYDGDGKTDLAVWRPSSGNWYILNSANNTVTVKGWGISTDIPVPADYDGDGLTDIAIYRPSDSNWYIIESSTTGRLATAGSDGTPAPSAYVR